MRIRVRRIRNARSNYILTRNKELTQIQKDAIVDFVVHRMLGEKVVSDMYELEEYLEEESEYIDETAQEKLKDRVSRGQAVFSGWVSFQSGMEIADLLQELWKVLEETDASAFTGIVTELQS